MLTRQRRMVINRPIRPATTWEISSLDPTSQDLCLWISKMCFSWFVFADYRECYLKLKHPILDIMRKRNVDTWLNKARITHSCERLVFQGFIAYQWKTFKYSDASKLSWYDVIVFKSESLIWHHNDDIEKYERNYKDWLSDSSRVAFSTTKDLLEEEL